MARRAESAKRQGSAEGRCGDGVVARLIGRLRRGVGPARLGPLEALQKHLVGEDGVDHPWGDIEAALGLPRQGKGVVVARRFDAGTLDCVVEALKEALRDDEPEVWQAVVNLLGGCGTRAAIEALVGELRLGEDPALVLCSLAACRDIEDLYDVIQPFFGEAKPPHVRRAALQALGSARNVKAIPALVSACALNDNDIALEARQALGQVLAWHPEALSPKLLRTLSSPISDAKAPEFVRWHAAWAASWLGGRAASVAPALHELIRSRDAMCKAAAVAALSAITPDDDRVVAYARELARDDNAWVKGVAEHVLSVCRRRADTPPGGRPSRGLKQRKQGGK